MSKIKTLPLTPKYSHHSKHYHRIIHTFLFVISLASSLSLRVEIHSGSQLYPVKPAARSLMNVPTSPRTATVGFQNISAFCKQEAPYSMSELLQRAYSKRSL